MRLFRVISILFISLFIFTSSVSAELCDNAHIKQLKALAENVDINYEYIDYGDKLSEGGDFILNTYLITVNLISDELFITHDGNDYYYNKNNNGKIELVVRSGNVRIDIKSSRCGNYKLRNINLSLPKFNVYSYRGECQKLSQYDLDVCDRWYQGAINDAYFNKVVSEYLDDDSEKDFNLWNKVVNFLGDNYLIVGVGLVFILLSIVLIVYYRKRSVLE